MVNIVQRPIDESALATLTAGGVSPTLARVLAARGIQQLEQLDATLSRLIPPERLSNNLAMAHLLADAIAAKRTMLVVGDYDADGATATAVAIRGLRSMGAHVDFLVPNRFEYGYGLTPEIVDLANSAGGGKPKPDIIITVDNGIASVEGVARANALGIQVLVTDHHLPADETPQAACIVNPNQRGCEFPSKNLAGVGVMFYVLLALRAELRKRGMFMQSPELISDHELKPKQEPNLTELLDLVALGTVADLVKLDDNNRILVEQGLRRIRAGKCCPAILALFKLAGRDAAQAGAQDLGFSIAPRLNAAGRLDDMSLGIACLITDDAEQAQQMAQRLHELNQERRSIESDMQEAADIVLDEFDVEKRYSLSIYDASWHQGVIGILASRIKERYHRPVIAFARAGESHEGLLKGSGRSIKGLHLRDALDLLSKRHPDLLVKFGGHAMAAGLSIRESDLPRFVTEFERVVTSLLTPIDLEAMLEVDGSMELNDMHWDMAAAIERQVWGQGFPQPTFFDSFNVAEQRIVGERHLKLTLEKNGRRISAIYFQQQELLPKRILAAYQLQTNQYNGVQAIQLSLKYWQQPVT